MRGKKVRTNADARNECMNWNGPNIEQLVGFGTR